jgi:hypothetical protein
VAGPSGHRPDDFKGTVTKKEAGKVGRGRGQPANGFVPSVCVRHARSELSDQFRKRLDDLLGPSSNTNKSASRFFDFLEFRGYKTISNKSKDRAAGRVCHHQYY